MGGGQAAEGISTRHPQPVGRDPSHDTISCHDAHPLKPLMAKIFEHLEPFAPGIWERAIEDWAGDRAKEFTWRKRTRFGGLYQVTVAERI